MILYATKIPVKPEFTKNKFMQLILQWGCGLQIEWDGVSYNLNIQEEEKNIVIEEINDVIAARYRIEAEKLWTTDVILNLQEQQIVIQCECDDIDYKFTPPHIIELILSSGLIQTDNELTISDRFSFITLKNYQILEDIMKHKYVLPVVYVTRNKYGKYPLYLKGLASKLQGAAHILVEGDPSPQKILQVEYMEQNVSDGKIGIYFPDPTMPCKKVNPKRQQPENVESQILHLIYSNQQFTKTYNWEWVQNELLRIRYEKLQQKREAMEREISEIIDVFDEQLTEQEKVIKEQNNKISALNHEIYGLRSKFERLNEIPLLYFGNEEDLYEGEIREIILDILTESLKEQTTDSRRVHILQDIIQNNIFLNIPSKKKLEIKQIMKSYNNMTGTTKQALQDFGFNVTSEKNHYKLTYFDDPRYYTTMAKSSSEYRSGQNLASEIINTML